MRRLNLKTIQYGGITILNQKPLAIPGGSIPIRIMILKGEITVLCPVNKLNSVPKGLPFKVQGDFVMANNFVDNHGLITETGRAYFWGTAIH